ncbi:MAG: pyrophosphate--fructose-6-phosphate 1-phosphotransferase [Planctomycetota bacterium]|jgi:pyrophosphate--fructose-6-phosphate 1-phosphotransferase|nr:pyrophosphate--fructose-6-phosphate 1-phosphotransferase [Planctomycetota bacterium]
MGVKTVALLTAGGLAPCLSSAVGGLIERYTEIAPEVRIICYIGGYKGLLLGESIEVTPAMRAKAGLLHRHGGSPIGNSRVKLTNAADCVKRGLTKEGEDPLTVAATQLTKDGVDVLHTIGGDDTNTTAADLAAYLAKNDYALGVVGLPKTIDNDVIPIRQSLGAWTAAEEGAKFFANVVSEHSANPRMLIIHEVMGRHCGWLTAATAQAYHEQLLHKSFAPGFPYDAKRIDVHGVYVPELALDIDAESARLTKIMDECDSVNIFIAEGAGTETIIAQLEAAGEEVPRDAFGHAKLDAVNPGKWYADQFKKRLGAEKVLVQKSGYFSRAAPANAEDLRLIKSCTDLAVDCALRGESGVIGHDEDQSMRLRAIEFPRIAGGKPFNVEEPWFLELLADIDQPKTETLTVAH